MFEVRLVPVRSCRAIIPLPSLSSIPRRKPWEYDRDLYRQRNLIGRAFNKLKHWCRIATRYDRRSLYYLSSLYLVSSVIWG